MRSRQAHLDCNKCAIVSTSRRSFSLAGQPLLLFDADTDVWPPGLLIRAQDWNRAMPSGSATEYWGDLALKHYYLSMTALSLDLFWGVVIHFCLAFHQKGGILFLIWRVFRSGGSIVVWHAAADSRVYGDISVCASSPRQLAIWELGIWLQMTLLHMGWGRSQEERGDKCVCVCVSCIGGCDTRCTASISTDTRGLSPS